MVRIKKLYSKVKHLKSYQLFESQSVDEIILEIKDILWPILIEGRYLISVDKSSSTYRFNTPPFVPGDIKEIIKIFIFKPGTKGDKIILNEEIIDAIHHLLSYTESLGFKCHQESSEFRFNLYGSSRFSTEPTYKTVQSMKGLENNINSKIDNINFEFTRLRKA